MSLKSSIINSIKSLPPLPRTIEEVDKIYANEESSIADLVKVLENDPMLVANLLKVANSPLYSFGKKIKNVSHAVSLFGMGMTRSIVLCNSVKKLLNVDMQPYGITPDKFAKISNLQANLIFNWYKQINEEKAEELYLAAFLQEMGKILISSDIIQDGETTSFLSEIKTSNNVAMVEKSYVDITTSEVTAAVFEHWGFESDFIDMIKYADNPSAAPQKLKEYSMALRIVKTIIPVNQPFSKIAINMGMTQAAQAGYDTQILENAINSVITRV